MRLTKVSSAPGTLGRRHQTIWIGFGALAQSRLKHPQWSPTSYGRQRESEGYVRWEKQTQSTPHIRWGVDLPGAEGGQPTSLRCAINTTA